MVRMSLWDVRKNDDYYFIDNQIRDMFDIGGVGVYLHKYIGVYSQGDTGDATLPDTNTTSGLNQLQDLLLLENRDRAYDKDVYELKAVYNVQDTEFDIRQFGLFLESDTIYLEFHINDTLEKIGRKLISGDVLEFPNMRDENLLDEDMPAINKYYVIQDVSRAADGWSAVWLPHIWRVKLKPMTASQEYDDILDKPVIDSDGNDTGKDVGDVIGGGDMTNEINDAIVEQAEAEVKLRNFETIQFYVIPGDEMGSQYPWIFAGDGVPPNGAALAGKGTSFPSTPQDRDWFLHTGMDPNVLYQYVVFPEKGPTGQPIPGTGHGVWQRREFDFRKKWQAAHRILETFINNKNISNINGTIMDERIMLSKAGIPKADF